MATQTLANPADVANRLRTHFSRKLLDPIEHELVLQQFAAAPEDIPANGGSKTIRFFRRRSASTTDVQALTDGTAINTFTEVASGYVDCTLAQRGEAARLSDVLQAVDIFNWMQQNVQCLSEDAALDFDTITRNAIRTGMHNSNGNFERFAGVTNTGNSATDFASLAALSAANANFTRTRALACATQLRKSKVPAIKGNYVAVVCPEIMHDIRLDTTWVASATNSKPDALYNKEVITLDGVRYVEGTNPFQETAYGTYAGAGTVFSAWFLGRQAFGCPKLSKLGNPLKPQVIVVNTPDSANPLNQFVTLGWKAFWNACLLSTNLSGDPTRLVQFRCKSTFA
jgi:N4-gp56 family major capsid protein